MNENNILVNSVKKALDILDILIFLDVKREGFALSDLAKRMELKPNTLHNLLKTMSTCGYVTQNDNSRYLAGKKCDDMILINSMTSNRSMEEKIKPAISDLSSIINESVVFTVLSNGNRIILDKIEHDHLIKIDITSMGNQHIYEKPTGRILTAYADETAFKHIKNKWGYPGILWDGINDEITFSKKLSEVRQRGLETVVDKNEQIISFAVPVLCMNSKIAGSIGVYAPFFRCDETKKSFIISELIKAAKQLEKIL